MAEPRITLTEVHKRYRIYSQRYRSLKEIALKRRFGEWEDRWALRGVSFEVDRGETLGLIGPNGAGKSTTLKLMARIMVPDRGSVQVRGRVGALLELGAGFQPDYTGRENVFLNASLLGFSRSVIQERFDEIVAFAELEDHIDAPLRTYSSGMSVRLGFSIAAHIDPDVMLLDEILAVGDESFQRKCFDRLAAFKANGCTIVLISHSMESIRQFCTRVAWIEHGQLRGLGPADEVVGAYLAQVEESLWATTQSEDQPLRVTKVRLLGADGEEIEVVRSGTPLTVEIAYRRTGKVDDPVFGVGIYRSDGLYVYGTDTAGADLSLRNLPPSGVIRLCYPALELLTGGYRLSVAVHGSRDVSSGPLDFHDRRYAFRVESSEDRGTVRLDHRWALDGVPTLG